MRTAVEALFDAMVTDGWATVSDGEVDSPTGHFALIMNDVADLHEIRQAFDDVIKTYGNPSDEDLTGTFLVITDSDGFIEIIRYPSKVSASSEFVEMTLRYSEWLDS